MKVSYIPYFHPVARTNSDRAVWNWHQVLKDEAKRVLDTSDEHPFHIGTFAPVGTFHSPPLRGHLVNSAKGLLLEVKIPVTDKICTEMLASNYKAVWVAEAVHMIGYYILLRWCGAKHNDGFFWIHAANANLHQVGWTENNRSAGFVLVPPYHIFQNKEQDAWVAYIQESVLGSYTTSDHFDFRGAEIAQNKFKPNERVETIHDEESSVLMPALIKRVLGRRVLLEYSKVDVDRAEQIEKDNMWKDMDDDLIYPVGFAATMGLKMTTNKKYRAHVDEVAAAIKAGVDEEAVPYTRFDAKKSTVYQWKGNEGAATWEENMVCEMIDRLDECQNILKAARVLKVLPDGYLQLGPEGADILNDSFYVHQTSSVLFPVGYAKKHGIALQGPKGDNEDVFEWDSFLARTNYPVAPDHFFHEANEDDVPFKVGMRLEAIDQNEKMLCPATVKAIKGRLVLISFDGWSDEFDQLYDFRSNELLPCGWGEMIGHALQKPERAEEKVLEAEEVMDEDEDME